MTDQFRLGHDLTIDRLGFGAMRLCQSHPGGPARDAESGRAVLRRAVELGVNHLDTAGFYRGPDGSTSANALIREALAPYPDTLVIASKAGPVFGPGGLRQASAAELRPQVEADLESLGLDRLDLVYLRIGKTDPPRGESLAERFEALAALREEGLIRHLGLSNVDTGHLAEARAIAPVAAVQNHFHIANRAERAVLDACEQAGIAFVPFFPLGGGRADIDDPALVKVAGRHGATAHQIALAWLLAVSPATLAIPGTGSVAHLEENLAARSIRLTEQDLADLA
ncbi:aryl-alcohol dehydrogenase-like predicted oxidoreductase [Nonomuraea thailandensis]|uniref:Aryl-alcohol dehydrogenase-like predicted oxidoreductase n=1 Tax=Nonomuraea thailandensis TaxID=1188745 RepID=A0A9X2GJW2_9ACTN|nr:aldo/keto reductase [Nonomuraea thailandensis]MCP2355543.1 aryl-alcohol dehydrogenase-like predicted oxidoreductase [Nonomuraea thailandensis]